MLPSLQQVVRGNAQLLLQWDLGSEPLLHTVLGGQSEVKMDMQPLAFMMQ